MVFKLPIMPFSQRQPLWQDGQSEMAKKKKQHFNVTKAVKAASRANIGPVPVTKRVPVKKKEPSIKHKISLEKLLSEGE